MELPPWAKNISEAWNLGQAAIGLWKWIVGSAMIGGFISWLLDAPKWQIFIAMLGASFVVGIVILIFQLRRLGQQRQPTIINTLGQILSQCSVVEFFPNRRALEKAYPLETIFTGENRIEGYFLSGEGLFNKRQTNMKYMRRILLPKPDAPYLRQLSELQNNIYLKSPAQIKDTTRLARQDEYKVEVRWFHDFMGMGLLFCNAKAETGSVNIEIIIPTVEADDRPSFRIERKYQRKTFDNLYDTYDRLYKGSYEPTTNDYL
jgi:hypothetical protein